MDSHYYHLFFRYCPFLHIFVAVSAVVIIEDHGHKSRWDMPTAENAARQKRETSFLALYGVSQSQLFPDDDGFC